MPVLEIYSLSAFVIKGSASATENDFTEVTRTTGAIESLLTTSDDTVYAGTMTIFGNESNGKLYKQKS